MIDRAKRLTGYIVLAGSLIVVVVCMYLVGTYNFLRLQRHQTQTIGESCKTVLQEDSITYPGNIEYYWTDGQPTPDGICAHMTSIPKPKWEEPFYFTVEMIQSDGTVAYAAFQKESDARHFIETSTYQRRTIIQDKERNTLHAEN